MPQPLNFGVDTFGEVECVQSDTAHDRDVLEIVSQIALAEAVGIDTFGIGEHHRSDFCVSAPDLVLAAGAVQTTRIGLSSAVTVLTTDDPIRVYERFATLSSLSNGRSQIVVGRGSFPEPFLLFNVNQALKDDIFEEKLISLTRLCRSREQNDLLDEGASRSSRHLGPVPRRSPQLSVAGLSGTSILRAASLDLPLVLPILRGDPQAYEALSGAYMRAGQGGKNLAVAIHSPGLIASTDSEAKERYWRCISRTNLVAGTKGTSGPLQKEAFLREIEVGSLYVGTPERVATKIVSALMSVGATSFRMRVGGGGLLPSEIRETITLFGSKVIPLVRAEFDSMSPG